VGRALELVAGYLFKPLKPIMVIPIFSPTSLTSA